MVEVVDSYELSPMQQGPLFHALSAHGTGVDIEQVVVRLGEPLDVTTLEQALRDVMQRHPILRRRQPHDEVRCPVAKRGFRRPTQNSSRLHS